MTDGKHGPLELVLKQVRQEVRLVLDGIDALSQLHPAVGALEARVVTGGDALEARVNLIKERAELDALVAENIRARRTAGLELVDRVAHHAVPIRFLERADLEWDLEFRADRVRELEVFFPGAMPEIRELVLEPDLQVESGHVVAFVLQQAQRDGAVHASGQQVRNSHASNIPFSNLWRGPLVL